MQQRLPQLTVEAKIVFLLMVSQVMICGAVPTTRSVLLRNECSGRNIRVFERNHTVAAVEENENDIYSNFTIKTLNKNLDLLIYSPVTNRCICFNKRWKLMALKCGCDEDRCNDKCLFRHDIGSDGFDIYKSVSDESRFIGFNRKGMPLNGKRSIFSKPTDRKRKKHVRHMKRNGKCFSFVKIDKKVDISKHNHQVSSHQHK